MKRQTKLRTDRRGCPIPGCTATMGLDQLMCRDHWYRLSAAVRERIWDLYRRERGSQRHRKACLDAILAVAREEREKKGGES